MFRGGEEGYFFLNPQKAFEFNSSPWARILLHPQTSCYHYFFRVGFPPLFNLGMEDLLYDHGVDLAVWAHEHNYERLLPIYNRQMMPGWLYQQQL